MKAFTLKTLLSCGFSQSLYISLMKKGGAILLLAFVTCFYDLCGS